MNYAHNINSNLYSTLQIDGNQNKKKKRFQIKYSTSSTLMPKEHHHCTLPKYLLNQLRFCRSTKASALAVKQIEKPLGKHQTIIMRSWHCVYPHSLTGNLLPFRETRTFHIAIECA